LDVVGKVEGIFSLGTIVGKKYKMRLIEKKTKQQFQ
jgi:hypothetical protein